MGIPDPQKIIEKIDDLPTLPRTVLKITELVNDPKSSAKDLARVITDDQVLTARLLKLVNSSFYGFPERISTVLLSSYEKLSRVDARNDGQLLFYDQVIPGSTLLGYINADHWALTVPIARSHSMLGSTVVDQNQYPREALLEAVLRFVEEELETSVR